MDSHWVNRKMKITPKGNRIGWKNDLMALLELKLA
jgi:hypothetical protein